MTRAATGRLGARLALLALACAVACARKGGDTSKDSGAADTAGAAEQHVPIDVERAAEIARLVAADPRRGDAVLLANGVTRPELDSLMYSIAADSALSVEFEQARKQR